MSFYIRKCLSLLIAISLILTPLLTNIVMAEETPKAVIQLSSENIKVGDVFTADIKFTNLEKYLSSQIAIYFDPNVVKVVDESGNPVDIIYDGISERSDMYSKGKGIFAETGSDVDNENGLLTYSLYISQDQKEITPPYPVSDGEFTVLTIRFKAIAAGDPKIQFAKENVTPVYDPANPNGSILLTTPGGSKVATEEQIPSITIEGDEPTIPVTGVSLDKNELTLTVGQTEKLTATVEPSNATNKNVSWSSSDTAVATVASDGTVTAVGAGTATITVTTEDGNKTATCTVTVTEPVVNLPFEIINVTREGTGDAIVTATIKRKDSSYTGNYVVVIQLMKDNEPIVYVSQEIKNPENEEMVAYTFNAQYTVQINVYSKMPTFDENGQPDLGEVLAVKVVK